MKGAGEKKRVVRVSVVSGSIWWLSVTVGILILRTVFSLPGREDGAAVRDGCRPQEGPQSH